MSKISSTRNRAETPQGSPADKIEYQTSGHLTRASLEAINAKNRQRLICGRCGEMGQLCRVELARFTVICYREGKFCCRPVQETTPELALKTWETFHDDY